MAARGNASPKKDCLAMTRPCGRCAPGGESKRDHAPNLLSASSYASNLLPLTVCLVTLTHKSRPSSTDHLNMVLMSTCNYGIVRFPVSGLGDADGLRPSTPTEAFVGEAKGVESAAVDPDSNVVSSRLVATPNTT